jgi:hypothetical protein
MPIIGATFAIIWKLFEEKKKERQKEKKNCKKNQLKKIKQYQGCERGTLKRRI